MSADSTAGVDSGVRRNDGAPHTSLDSRTSHLSRSRFERKWISQSRPSGILRWTGNPRHPGERRDPRRAPVLRRAASTQADATKGGALPLLGTGKIEENKPGWRDLSEEIAG